MIEWAPENAERPEGADAWKVIAASSAEDTRRFLTGDDDANMTIQDAELARRFAEQQRLIIEAVDVARRQRVDLSQRDGRVQMAAILIPRLVDLSAQTARRVDELADAVTAGDPIAAATADTLLLTLMHELFKFAGLQATGPSYPALPPKAR